MTGPTFVIPGRGAAKRSREPGTHDHRPRRMSTVAKPVFMGSGLAASR
jgi:hypothetical protein